jgi:hypothetical protein
MEQVENDEYHEQSNPPLEPNHPFVQWLRTYLLWARLPEIDPQVIAFDDGYANTVEELLRWEKQNLWVERSLLERMPHRLLALLAVRNYVEEQIWRRHLTTGIIFLLIVAAAAFVGALYVQSRLRLSLLWQLVHLLVIPLVAQLSSLLREYTRQCADEEINQRIGEPQLFFLAIQQAIQESYRNGAPDSDLLRMLRRLNRIGAKSGEPPRTLEQLKSLAGEPIPAPVAAEQAEETIQNSATRKEELTS